MSRGRLLGARRVVLVVCLFTLSGCGGPPQFGDEKGLKAADALWTAVTARRRDLVDASAVEIEKLHQAAELPPDAFASLMSVVEAARAGQWIEARVSLKALIRGQRRAQ